MKCNISLGKEEIPLFEAAIVDEDFSTWSYICDVDPDISKFNV